jgi:hypothetical protein
MQVSKQCVGNVPITGICNFTTSLLRRGNKSIHISLKKQASDASEVQDPIIIDAADLTDEVFVKRYADMVGLDPGVVRFEWRNATKAEQETLHKVERRMKDTLLGSTGVLSSKLDVGNIDIEQEKRKWKTEFGDVLADRLESLVRSAMGDYEWLRERRLRL